MATKKDSKSLVLSRIDFLLNLCDDILHQPVSIPLTLSQTTDATAGPASGDATGATTIDLVANSNTNTISIWQCWLLIICGEYVDARAGLLAIILNNSDKLNNEKAYFLLSLCCEGRASTELIDLLEIGLTLNDNSTLLKYAIRKVNAAEAPDITELSSMSESVRILLERDAQQNQSEKLLPVISKVLRQIVANPWQAKHRNFNFTNITTKTASPKMHVYFADILMRIGFKIKKIQTKNENENKRNANLKKDAMTMVLETNSTEENERFLAKVMEFQKLGTLTAKIKAEWAELTAKLQSDKKDDVHDFPHNPPIIRLHFILSFYSEWLAMKVQKKQCVPLMVSLFECLTKYSVVDLRNDFDVVKDKFLLTDDKALRTKTTRFFKSRGGLCCDMKASCATTEAEEKKENDNTIIPHHKLCVSQSRNSRDRHQDKLENKRRELYFLSPESKEKPNVGRARSRNRSEIALEAELDMIHAALIHGEEHEIVVNSDKFTTHEPEADENKLGTYSFGNSFHFSYWDPLDDTYIQPKYPDLKTELVKNNIYNITPEMYDFLEDRAIIFLCSEKAKNYRCTRQSYRYSFSGLALNSMIQLHHTIAVMAYCNLDDLQRAFKEKGFRALDNKPLSVRRTAHSEIVHFCKALHEAISTFGSPLRKRGDGVRYYHGMSRKLLFNAFTVMFQIPASLTESQIVANSFSSNGNGVVIEVCHSGGRASSSVCLNVEPFSDFQHERERLIVKTEVSLLKVFIDGVEHSNWIAILKVWGEIISGKFIVHHFKQMPEKKRYELQVSLVDLINNYMLRKQKKTEKEHGYKIGIPKYIEMCFEATLKSNNEAQSHVFYLLESEINSGRLIPPLRQLLAANGKFIIFLRCAHTGHVSIHRSESFDCVLKKMDIWRMISHEKGGKMWVSPTTERIYFCEVKAAHNDERVTPIREEFIDIRCMWRSDPNTGLFDFSLQFERVPKNIAVLHFVSCIRCQELNCGHSAQVTWNFTRQNVTHVIHSRQFESSELLAFESVTLKIVMYLTTITYSNHRVAYVTSGPKNTEDLDNTDSDDNDDMSDEELLAKALAMSMENDDENEVQ